MIESENVVGREPDARHAQVAQGLIMRAKGQLAHLGEEPVRADHQVEGPGLAVFERDRDTVVVLGERGDGVAEDVSELRLGQTVQDPRQLRLGHLQFPGEHLGREPADLHSVRVDECGAAHRGVEAADLVQHTEFVQDVEGAAAEVDGVAASAKAGSAFDDGDLVAVSVEEVSEGGTRHTGT